MVNDIKEKKVKKLLWGLIFGVFLFIFGYGLINYIFYNPEKRIKNIFSSLIPEPTISVFEKKCGFKNPPELDEDAKKTLSLWENTLHEFGDDISWSKHDCIKIEYRQLSSDNLGEFFPGNGNKLQDFIIYLDDSLRGNYVISSVILMHEISHLNQFIERINSGFKIDCIAAEVDAYHNEISYIWKLNENNLKFFNNYVSQLKEKPDIKSKTMANDFLGMDEVMEKCGNACPKDVVYDKCVWDCFDLTMEKNIRNTPKYIERCKEKEI